MMLYSQILFIKKGKVEIVGKVIRKSLSMVMVFVLMLGILSSTNKVFADNSNAEPLMYLYDVNMDNGDTTDRTQQTLNDNYWVDLEKRYVINVSGAAGVGNNTMFGLFPKYITPPSNTAINSIAAFHGIDLLAVVNNFPNTGIRANGHTLDTAYYETLKWYSLLPTDAWRNPYNFTQNEILTSGEVGNPDEKLAVYSDLYAKDSNGSSAIGRYNRGDEIPLEFSLSASWFKRYLKGFTLEMFGGGGTNLQNINRRAGQYAVSDAGLAFTVDIPEGVVVSDNPKAKIEGLNGFSAAVSKEDGKLVVRLSKNEKAKKYKLKDLLDKVSAEDADNIRVSISGIKVADNAAPDTQITLKGTAAGFYDFALSETEEFYSFSQNHTQGAAERYYTFFAAKQSISGRDAAAPQDKPNLISYTFKVNKAAENTTPSNPGKTVKVVKKTKTPKTGDDADIMLYVLLLGVSGTMLAGVSYFRRRKVS